MAGEVEVRVEADDLKDLVKAIKQHENSRALMKELRRDIRKSLAPALPAIRSAVKKIPSKGESARLKRPSLRKSTARAARLQVKVTAKAAGATLRVDPKKMPAHQHNLPAYLNGTFTPWRARNFGRKDFHTQRAHPYFDPVVRRVEPAAIRSVEATMDHLRRQMEA